MGNDTFKSVTFGGFDKQDVVNYIEKAAKETAAVQEKLQQEQEALQKDNASLREQLAESQTFQQALIAQRDQLQETLSQETAVRQELEPLKVQVEALAAEVDRLRPEAEAYAQFRERIGTIECDAHKRAAELEASTVVKLEKMVAAFRTQYQEVATSFDTTATHVTAELRKIEVNLAQLPRAMDQAGVELNELSTVLDREKGSN